MRRRYSEKDAVTGQGPKQVDIDTARGGRFGIFSPREIWTYLFPLVKSEESEMLSEK